MTILITLRTLSIFKFILPVCMYLHCNVSSAVEINGYVIDNISKLPVSDVHIYSTNNLRTGTVTNENGKFSIYLKSYDTLVFSHINYKTLIIYPPETKKDLRIELEQNETMLEEITVTTLSPRQIVEKAIKNLRDNHFVEPINYSFFTRFIRYQKDSTLDIIEEYAGNIYFKKNHNALFLFKKSRAKMGVNTSEKFNSQRMTGMSKMYIDNTFKYLDDYLHPGKYKHYEYEFVDYLVLDERPMCKIKFYTNKDTYYKSGFLIIDAVTYAVAQNILNPKNGYADKVLKYKMVNNKWHLSYTKDVLHSIAGFINERITLYNISNEAINSEYLSTSSVHTRKTNKFVAEYEKDFWHDSNHIILPEWLKKQL